MMRWMGVATVWLVWCIMLASAMTASGGYDREHIASSPVPHAPLSGCDPMDRVNTSGSMVTGTSVVETLAIRGDTLYAGTHDGRISVVELPTQSMRNVSAGAGVNALSLSPDGGVLAAAGSDGTVRVYDTVSLNVERIFLHGSTNVWDVVVTPGEVISAGGDRRIAVWNLSTGSLEFDVRTTSSVRSLALSRNGELVAGLYNGEVYLVDRNGSGVLTRLYAHAGAVRSLAWDPQGERLASASADRTLRIRDAMGDITTVGAASGGLYAAAWLGDHILTAGTDGHVRVWSPDGGAERDFDVGSSVHSLASGNGSFFSGDIHGRITTFSDRDAPVLHWFDIHPEISSARNVTFEGEFDECITRAGVSLDPPVTQTAFSVRVDGRSITGSVDLPVDAPDGVYTISLLNVSDPSGNTRPHTDAGVFTFDTQAPRILSHTISRGSPLPPGPVEFHTLFSEPMDAGSVHVYLTDDRTEYTVDDLKWSGQTDNLTSRFDLTPMMAPGEYTFLLSGEDLAGNDMQVFRSTFIYDPEPPLADAGGDITVAQGEAVTLDGSGSVGASRFIWDIGGLQITGAVVHHTFSLPGTYNATLTVYDEANNSDSDMALIHVRDTLPPEVSIGPVMELTRENITPLPYTLADPGGLSDLRITVTHTPSGERRGVLVHINGETSVSDTAHIPFLREGEHVIRVSACDPHGNCNGSLPALSVRYDPTPPQLVGFSPVHALSTRVDLRLAFSEPVNVSDVMVSGGVPPALVRSDGSRVHILLDGLSRGMVYTAYVSGSDAAGNVFELSVTFDVTIPVSDILAQGVGFGSAGFALAFLLAWRWAGKRRAKRRPVHPLRTGKRDNPTEKRDDIDRAVREFRMRYVHSGRRSDRNEHKLHKTRRVKGRWPGDLNEPRDTSGQHVSREGGTPRTGTHAPTGARGGAGGAGRRTDPG